MIRRYRESGFGRRRRRIRRARTMTEQADSRRTALIAAAQARWVDALTDLGGRNTLLYYKDRRAGTRALAAAEPGMAERVLPTGSIRLPRLFPDAAARADGVRGGPHTPPTARHVSGGRTVP